MKSILLLAVSTLFFGLPQQLNAQAPKAEALAEGTSMEILTAKVEKVFKFADSDGFQFVAYQVSYKGSNVIVEDPIGSTNLAVGDELRFMAIRHDLSKSAKGSKKVVSFLVTKPKSK